MDNSSEAVDEALKTLHEVTAARRAASNDHDRVMLIVMEIEAERRHHAALRAEKVPRVNCRRCQRRLEPGEPMIWLFRYGFVHLCLHCDRSEHASADRLVGLDQQPCETCARTMYFEPSSCFYRRPVTCSHQCGYRRKLKRQLERKRVRHEEITCACGKAFVPKRSDASTCSNRCRQKLHRQRQRA